MAIVNLMQSTGGRAARAAAGAVLVAVGVVLGGGWLALAVVGLLPLAAGVFDFCLLAPLAHQAIRVTHGQRS